MMTKAVKFVFLGVWNQLWRGVKKGLSWMKDSVVQSFRHVELAACFLLFTASVVFSVANSWHVWVMRMLPIPYASELVRGVSCFLAFAAGFGFCCFNKSLIRRAAEKEAEEIVRENDKMHELEKERDRLKEEIERASSTIKEQAREINGQKDKIRKLESSRINLTAIKPILNLGVADVEMSVKEPFEEWIDGSFVKRSFHRPTAKKFVGVLQKDFPVRLGVDLRRVNIRVDEGSKTIYVTNVTPEPFAGESHPKWLVSETREYKFHEDNAKGCLESNGKKWAVDDENDVTVSLKDEFIPSCQDKFAAALSQRIKEPSFEGYELATRFARTVAEQFLRVVLAPCVQDGYFLDFSKKENEVTTWPHPCKELMAFAEEYGNQAT